MNRLIAVLAAGACLTGFGAPELDGIFRDGFVFSAAHPTRVAGRAAPGAKVTVKASGVTACATAGADGRFAAELPALGVRKEPFVLEASDATGVTKVADCVSGLVLLAAGQSNMEVPVKEALDPEQEIAAANFPLIREFKVEHDFDFAPRTECAGRWTAVSPQTAAKIGAIGYFTARRLHRELDGIPVGIVNNSYSATSIQPWLPLEILREKYANSLRNYDKFKPLGHDGVIRRREELGKTLLVQDAGNRGEEMGWHRGAQADWQDVRMPCWLDYEVYGEASDGAFWIARTFEAPDDFLDRDIEFRASSIDDYDITYLNGVRIGSTGEETPDSYDMPRAYRIAKGLLRKGENTIAIRIFDTAHAGGIAPGSTIALACGEKEFSLAGTWKTKAELILKAKAWPADYLTLVKFYHTGSVLYNAMFAPVSKVPYDAMLWYQGESNAGSAKYGEMLEDLITRWRADVGQPDVPFVVMQLAAFRDRPKSAADAGNWPLTRQHQAEARRLANVRLVPTIDIGDARRIHPLNKQEVGRRTALVLLQDFWAKDRFRGVVAYPEAVRVVRRGATLVVGLKDAKGLATTDGRTPQSFAVVGPKDPKTRKAPVAWAAARIDGERIVVEIPAEIPEPASLRYAWHMNPDVNTVNGLGFPLLPFELAVK